MSSKERSSYSIGQPMKATADATKAVGGSEEDAVRAVGVANQSHGGSDGGHQDGKQLPDALSAAVSLQACEEGMDGMSAGAIAGQIVRDVVKRATRGIGCGVLDSQGDRCQG